MFVDVSISDLRIVRELRLTLGEGCNLLTGPNGAGKTTFLEALYLLALGRSFRHREPAPLIREGAEAAELFTRFRDAAGGRHVLGLRRERQQLLVRLDGRSSVRRSEIVRALPIQFIGPDPQRLIEGSPEVRRQLLDSGLFHVEQDYLRLLQRYHRALQQRNASLRQGNRLEAQWDEVLITAGEAIDRARSGHVQALISETRDVLASWGLSMAVSFSYRPGWRAGISLADSLREHRDGDRRQGFTGVGPHRADLIIDTEVGTGRKTLSRGQLKMLVAALTVAQARLLESRAGVRPVLLFDDLPAELDPGNRERLLQTLNATYRQWVVTALDPGTLPEVAGRMFHVEQGALIED